MAQLRVQNLSGQTDSMYYKVHLQYHDYNIRIKIFLNSAIYTVIHDTVFLKNVMIFEDRPKVFLSFCAVNANLMFRQ